MWALLYAEGIQHKVGLSLLAFFPKKKKELKQTVQSLTQIETTQIKVTVNNKYTIKPINN